MIKLIKNAQVYAPENLGRKDILLAGKKIIHIADCIDPAGLPLETIEAADKIATPGIIDMHVHLTGGGGEAGFKSRAPEVNLSDLVRGGITTVLGLLGTDAAGRSIENLLAKAKALREEGLTAYVVTGAYQYPSPTLTGTVKNDLVFIDEVVGVKIALSDHRSSQVSRHELARLVAEARVGGMLGNKAGIVIIHMGDGREGLRHVADLIDQGDLPADHFRPTHLNRNPTLLAESIALLDKGLNIDLTAGAGSSNDSAAAVIARLHESGKNLSQVTMSSDGNGSWSRYDANGRLSKIGVSPVDTVLTETKKLINDFSLPIEQALGISCVNPARALHIYPRKGVLRVGSDADILLFDRQWQLRDVLAAGQMMMRQSEVIVKGAFEQ